MSPDADSDLIFVKRLCTSDVRQSSFNISGRGKRGICNIGFKKLWDALTNAEKVVVAQESGQPSEPWGLPVLLLYRREFVYPTTWLRRYGNLS